MTKKTFILFLCFFAFKLTVGQIGTSTYNRWFIDKPTTKQDSSEIIKHGYSKINVYEVEIDDSLKQHKTFYCSWTIKLVDGKITSTPDKTRPNQFEIIKAQKFTKKKIIENIADEYELTHFLNSSGQIIKSINKCNHCKFESRYNNFGPVEYKYKDGLLEEASYYGDGGHIIKGFNYAKYVFVYEK